jgi:SAM-dependent methyltransferase
MLYNESLWFRKTLTTYLRSGDIVMNLGASTLKFRTVDQPHIQANLFEPLEAQGVRVIHVDLKRADGVDLVGDLTDPRFVAELRAYTPQAVICSNLLEHLPQRKLFCAATSQLLRPDGIIFASCPYDYPYHPDPIDTMFRPTVDQLAAEFPSTGLLTGEIVACGTWRDKIERDRLRAPRQWQMQQRNRYIKMFLPFYKPEAWWRSVTRQDRFAMDQKISATCAVLRKDADPQ